MWVGTLIISLLFVIVGAQQLGSQRPDRLAVMLGRSSSAQPQACWYAICPGHVSREMSVRVLTDIVKTNTAKIVYKTSVNEGRYSVSYDACAAFMLLHWRTCIGGYLISDERNSYVRIKLLDRNVRLSELIAHLGTPSAASLCAGSLTIQSGSGIQGIWASIFYENGISISAFKVSKRNLSIVPIPSDEWRVSPDMVVNEIIFSLGSPAINYVSNDPDEPIFSWHGFTEGSATQFSCE